MGIAENSEGNQDFVLVSDKKKVFLEPTFFVAQEIGVSNIPGPCVAVYCKYPWLLRSHEISSTTAPVPHPWPTALMMMCEEGKA